MPFTPPAERTGLASIGITALAVAVFLPTAGTFFLSDDFDLLRWVATAPLSDALVRPLWWGWFRPVPELLWRATYHLFALSPVGHHLVDIAIHAANATLVGQIARRVEGSARTGLIAGALFATAPAAVAVVPWLAGRYDLVATLFVLLAVLSALRLGESQRPIWALALALCSCAALASKESATALPFMLAVMASRRRTEAPPPRLIPVRAVVGVAMLTAVYLAGRAFAYGGLGGYGHHATVQLSHLLNPMLALPSTVLPVHFDTPLEGRSAYIWYPAALFLFAFLLARAPFWCLLYIAAVVPVANLLGSGTFVLAEVHRLLYLPGAAVSGALATVICDARRGLVRVSGAPLAMPLICLLLAAQVVGLITYQGAWRSAGRVTWRVHTTLLESRGLLPPNTVIDCDALPDNISGAWVYRTGCDSHIRLVWPDGSVRGARLGNAVWRERERAQHAYRLSPTGAELVRVR